MNNMKYAIIKTKKYYQGNPDLIELCYELAYRDYVTHELAVIDKNKLINPDHYIIIQYWE